MYHILQLWRSSRHFATYLATACLATYGIHIGKLESEYYMIIICTCFTALITGGAAVERGRSKGPIESILKKAGHRLGLQEMAVIADETDKHNLTSRRNRTQ